MIARSVPLGAALLSALTLLSAGVAGAQEQAAPAPQTAPAATPTDSAAAPQDSGATYESARNQLGVLIYCQEKGFIDAAAVETQNRLLAMIPPGDTAKGDAAEAKGKAGTVSAMGVERSLADAAKEQNSSEEALCKQMDALLKQLASQVPA